VTPTPTTPAVINPPLPANGPPGEVLLFDDFEDGDDAGWIADEADGDDLVGSWAVVEAEEGRVYAQSDASFSDESWSVGGNLSWTDVQLDVRFRFTEVSDIEDAIALIALRFRSKDDYYYIEYGGDGAVKIRKRVDGSEPELASVDLDRVAVVGEWVDVQFTARGSSLQVSVGGVVLGNAVTDTDLPSGGIALGVRENAAVEFDNVRVTVP
jgi:hypothetical protein